MQIFIYHLYYNSNTMMEITQVRLPKGLIKEIDSVVHKGVYSSKSDFIREAIRKSILELQIGSIKRGLKDASEGKIRER